MHPVTRKVCFVLQNFLGKGTSCLFPLHPTGCGTALALSQHRTENVSPFHHSSGDFTLPTPIDQRAFLPFGHLAISWRPTVRRLVAVSVFPLNHTNIKIKYISRNWLFTSCP
jgi:hypothetical protein